MIRPTAALILVALAAGACTPLRSHQGYIIDADLVNSIQPGVDNRATVSKVLGEPTVKGQFDDREWYYVSRDARNLAFNNPKPSQQTTLRVRFDPAGNVTAVDRMGLEQVASLRPYGKTTPTLGRKRSFFEDLFGNIGSVGTLGGGAGAPGGDGGP